MKKYFIVFTSAVFAAYAIYEKFLLPELQIPMIVTILFSLLFACFFRMYGVVSASTRSHNLSYFLFSLFLVIGDSFKKYGSFWGVWGNPFVDSDLAVLLFEDMASFFGFLNGFAGNLLMILSSICKGIGYFFILQYTFESANISAKNIYSFLLLPFAHLQTVSGRKMPSCVSFCFYSLHGSHIY